MDNALLVHWSQAERTLWDNMTLRHPHLQEMIATKITKTLKSGATYTSNLSKPIIEWLDLLQVWKDEPITVKGCLSFSLKQVVKTLHHHGLVKTIWQDNIDAQTVMLLVYRAFSACENKKSKQETIERVEKYNYIDCRSLYEILSLLKSRSFFLKTN